MSFSDALQGMLAQSWLQLSLAALIGVPVAALGGGLTWFARRDGALAGQAALAGFATVFTLFLLGYTTANARSSVVGDVAPVLLSGLAFLTSFSVIQNRVGVVPASLVAITATAALFLGMTLGGMNRQANEAQAAATQPPLVVQVPQPLRVTVTEHRDTGTLSWQDTTGGADELFDLSGLGEQAQEETTGAPVTCRFGPDFQITCPRFGGMGTTFSLTDAARDLLTDLGVPPEGDGYSLTCGSGLDQPERCSLVTPLDTTGLLDGVTLFAPPSEGN